MSHSCANCYLPVESIWSHRTETSWTCKSAEPEARRSLAKIASILSGIAIDDLTMAEKQIVGILREGKWIKFGTELGIPMIELGEKVVL